jgi:hypothetical protein
MGLRNNETLFFPIFACPLKAEMVNMVVPLARKCIWDVFFFVEDDGMGWGKLVKDGCLHR